MAARPGRRPAARRNGDRAKLLSERDRERGAAVLHLAAPADEDHELLLASYDAAMGVALGEMERTFLAASGGWAERMSSAIGHLLGLAAANPDQARLCTVGIFAAGPRGLERRDRWMLRFMDLCEAGYEQSGAPEEIPTRLMPQVVAGAVFELIRSHVAEDRLSELIDALPAATLIVLSPIVGRREALRVAYRVTD